MTAANKHVDILLVDDDIDLLTSMAELLADCGYRVKTCSDADSALDFAVDRTFSVGLFDYRLGSLKNGLDVVESMQSMGCKSAFVMITADVEQATAIRALHLNLFDFMKKPVEPERLLGTVQRAMDHAQNLAA
jgi:two-component system phosphoglycerate transport system response regulator PgtA